MTHYRRRRRRRNGKSIAAIALCLGALLLVTGVVSWALWATRGPEGEGVEVPDYVDRATIPVNEYSRPGTELTEINGVVIHYVGNPGTSARANRNYFASLADGREDTYASSHFIVGLEGEVLQCIPLTEVAYASKDRNDDTVAIEVCHPDETGAFTAVTEERLVELTAWLCREFEVDVETGLLRHYDVTGKVCPKWYVENQDAWEAFKAAVEEKL